MRLLALGSAEQSAFAEAFVPCRCGNAETQIFTLIDKVDINSGSFNATLLANYYLNAEGGSLNAIAKNATGVDFVAMQNTINTTIADTITVSGTGNHGPVNLLCSCAVKAPCCCKVCTPLAHIA